MEKKRILKKIAACLTAAVMILTLALPVQAASYKKAQTRVIRAGESYHLIDNNINKNQVIRYAVKITHY